eukprot:518714-Pyramimonas_sp.AAC.1
MVMPCLMPQRTWAARALPEPTRLETSLVRESHGPWAVPGWPCHRASPVWRTEGLRPTGLQNLLELPDAGRRRVALGPNGALARISHKTAP